MQRYFMHLRDPSDELLDPDGVLMSEDDVVAAALEAARDCMAHDLRSGRLALNYRIDVQEATRSVIHTLRFADAVTIVPA